MKQLSATQDGVVLLTADQASQVGGGLSPLVPVKVLQVQAQDMYGNTMSAEDYMEWTRREHDPANGDSIHDFPGGPGQ
jgi:hypothetical protein